MIDAFDAAILKTLMTDTRMSTVQIGETVHLSHSSVARRLNRLAEIGVFDASGQQPNWRLLGYDVQAELLISRCTQIDRETAWTSICNHSNILSLRIITGAYDFLATAIARNLEEYGQIIDSLIALETVDNVESFMVLRQSDGDRMSELIDEANA
ncbi:MAG: Lrp/AsnC family transcriptional regulator [Pseudomonadota bacterium]